MELQAGYGTDPGRFGYEYFSPTEGVKFRAPAVDLNKPYGVCVGAAQTFGRLVTHPFPCLISDKIHLPVLNMGIGGAGPEDFIKPYPLQVMQNAEFVVLQAMSARSVDCSWYKHCGYQCIWRATKEKIEVNEAWERILALDAEEEVLAEVRARWVSAYRLLLGQCPDKTILLWMGKRGHKLDLIPSDGLMNAMCTFPQFVSPKNWRQVKKMAWKHVEVVTSEPIIFDPPVVITSMGDKPLKCDNYYPNQEYHKDVAERICKHLESA